MTPRGGYISGGKDMTMCADGSFVSGTRCELTPSGKFIGRQD
jgi:hypothetical protein